MDNGIHFIAGLPRSGSTLLAGILRQNPRFHASMMSPVGEIFNAMLRATSVKNEAAIFIEPDDGRLAGFRYRMLRSIFENYYSDEDANERALNEVNFDTNRGWTTKLPALVELFPDCRVICCVRNPAWIIDSVERLIKSNPFDLSGIFNFEAGGTVVTRAEQLCKSDGMLGFAYGGLKEAVFGQHADRVLVIRYETLVYDPEWVMASIYAFIEESPYIPHDFEHIAPCPLTEEFDARLGTPGLHRVAPKVTVPDYKTVLPPDLFARYEKDAFWEGEIPVKVI